MWEAWSEGILIFPFPGSRAHANVVFHLINVQMTLHHLAAPNMLHQNAAPAVPKHGARA